MSEQLPLSLTPAARSEAGLYLYLYPDDNARPQLAERIEGLRIRHRLAGRARPLESLHVPILHIGQYDDVPAEIVAKATEAAGAVRSAPFEVMFDEAATFTGSLAIVLRSSDDLLELAMLRDQVYRLMRNAGLSPRPVIANPQMVLMRDLRVLAPERLEPVRWMVRTFALVEQRTGAAPIERGRWDLRP